MWGGRYDFVFVNNHVFSECTNGRPTNAADDAESIAERYHASDDVFDKRAKLNAKI
jgi:hypothetical protein